MPDLKSGSVHQSSVPAAAQCGAKGVIEHLPIDLPRLEAASIETKAPWEYVIVDIGSLPALI